jgi:hypothetical protein
MKRFYIELPIGLADGDEVASFDEGIGPEPDWEPGSVLVDDEAILCIADSTEGRSTLTLIGGHRYAIYASYAEVADAIRAAVREGLCFTAVERSTR